jgi:hypothetical protein
MKPLALDAIARNTPSQPQPHSRGVGPVRRWRVSIIGRLLEIALKETPDQSGIHADRCPESNPLRPGCNRLPCRLAPASCSVPARNRTWSSTIAKSRANPAHSKDMSIKVPCLGIEPGLAVPQTAVQAITLTRSIQYPAMPHRIGKSTKKARSMPGFVVYIPIARHESLVVLAVCRLIFVSS